MKKFSFVILNYNTYDETVDCIDYLKKLKNQNQISIIVVDNNSPDGSGEKIEKYYENDNQVIVLFSKKNVGFSRGNNIGFQYAKNNQYADFIILCNSDTEILTTDFCDKVEKDYEKYNFALLGPKIILSDKSLQGFIVNGIPTKKDIYKILISVNLNYIKSLFNINNENKPNNSGKKNSQIDSINNVVEGKTLSGCFYVFSREYIDIFDGLDDRTFMYGEEILLAVIMNRYNLKSIYDPNIVINHLVGASVSNERGSMLKKKKFLAENVNKSMKFALKEINKK